MTIDGVILTPLRIISLPAGDVLHGIKASAPGFMGFGEAYFSTVNPGEIKAWKKHLRMTLNLVVPVGAVKFVIYDDRPDSKTTGDFQAIELSRNNYQRLTVPPGLWTGFRGVSTGLNLVLNVANMEHDPDEMVRLDSKDIVYQW